MKSICLIYIEMRGHRMLFNSIVSSSDSFMMSFFNSLISFASKLPIFFEKYADFEWPANRPEPCHRKQYILRGARPLFLTFVKIGL